MPFLSLQEGRFCFTTTQSRKNVTNRRYIVKRILKKCLSRTTTSVTTTGETLQPLAVAGNEIGLDIIAPGFLDVGQMAFFGVRLFNCKTKRYTK